MAHALRQQRHEEPDEPARQRAARKTGEEREESEPRKPCAPSAPGWKALHKAINRAGEERGREHRIREIARQPEPAERQEKHERAAKPARRSAELLADERDQGDQRHGRERAGQAG